MGSSSQQFCVRWNSYQSNLQNAFPKLLVNENFVDVTLACEAQMIKCHKVVLSACSSYFEQLLSQNPCQHPIIFMKDMKFWEVRALVDFMYRGEVNVTQEELSKLLRAAEALQVRGLYGYEQQRAAAAAAACGKTSGDQADEGRGRVTPALPANTTVQECKSQSRASTPNQDDSNDQMVKLEEEIMMMEEQSISDMDSHLENDFPAIASSSQEFDGFVGDQRYPAPASVDLDQEAGPSGLTMTPNSAPSTPSADRSLAQDGATSPPLQMFRTPGWKQSRAPVVAAANKTNNRGPTIWESLPKEDMMKQLTLAVELIEKGNSYRRVSNLLHIPKSTIYSYVMKSREGKDLFRRKSPTRSVLVKKTPALLKTKFKFAKAKAGKAKATNSKPSTTHEQDSPHSSLSAEESQ